MSTYQTRETQHIKKLSVFVQLLNGQVESNGSQLQNKP